VNEDGITRREADTSKIRRKAAAGGDQLAAPA
jgi:hypothetical protein